MKYGESAICIRAPVCDDAAAGMANQSAQPAACVLADASCGEHGECMASPLNTLGQQRTLAPVHHVEHSLVDRRVHIVRAYGARAGCTGSARKNATAAADDLAPRWPAGRWPATTGVVPYGAFVDVGVSKDGMLHATETPSLVVAPVSDMRRFVSVVDWLLLLYVCEADEAEGRRTLSLGCGLASAALRHQPPHPMLIRSCGSVHSCANSNSEFAIAMRIHDVFQP
jgi:hypothetical protein